MVEVVAEALVVQVVEVLPLLSTLAAVAAGKTCPRSAKHSRTFRASPRAISVDVALFVTSWFRTRRVP